MSKDATSRLAFPAKDGRFNKRKESLKKSLVDGIWGLGGGGGKIYRSVFASGIGDFEVARDKDVHNSLVDAGPLIPQGGGYQLSHQPFDLLFAHPQLPMISYPGVNKGDRYFSVPGRPKQRFLR